MTAGALLRNTLRFARMLRDLGVQVDPDRVRLFAQALTFIQISDRAEFYHAAKCCLLTREQDREAFDRAFRAFWRASFRGGIPLTIPGRGHRHVPRPEICPPGSETDRARASGDGQEKGDPLVVEAALSYSAREALRQKDFSDLTPDELQAVKALIDRLTWRLGDRPSRRQRVGDGRFLDHRRTFRASLRLGGEIMRWALRAPKRKPRPLVVIADVSGSMERYTRMLLHFLYGLSQGLDQHVEAFLFSTRLTRITRQLRGGDAERALDEVSRQVPDWSGGTKIGAALKTFNFRWGRQVLSRGAIVTLISDGLDRGEIDLLRTEIARLQRSCYRLMWVNPLLGSRGYEPLARGMQTSLPYIDDFLPARNLVSLERLADHILSTSGRRPVRHQIASCA